jgi:hypothetical protein
MRSVLLCTDRFPLEESMILSVSRRTDVPRFYMEWFLQRLREGYADVRNPMNPRRVSRVPLTKDTVDAVAASLILEGYLAFRTRN